MGTALLAGPPISGPSCPCLVAFADTQPTPPLPCPFSFSLPSMPQEGSAAQWQPLAHRQCVAEAVSALQAATGGKPGADGAQPLAAMRKALPGPAYMFCFPILRAVMR